MRLLVSLFDFVWMPFTRYIEHPRNPPKPLWTDGADDASLR